MDWANAGPPGQEAKDPHSGPCVFSDIASVLARIAGAIFAKSRAVDRARAALFSSGVKEFDFASVHMCRIFL